MLTAEQVVGQQQDFANFITLVKAHETPLLNRLPKGPKLTNKIHVFLMDKYPDPADLAWADGRDWDTFNNAGANRAEAKCRMQQFSTTAEVSVLGEEATTVPGVNKGELAREIQHRLVQMGQSVECAIGSDQAAQEYLNRDVPDKCQGVGLTIQSGTTSQIYPTPAGYRPAAAQIYSDVKANLVEDSTKALLQAQWSATASSGRLALFVGPNLKDRISGFPFYLPSSTSTQSTSRVSNREISNTTIGQMIDVIQSEYGTYQIELSKFLAHTSHGGTAGKSAWRGYGLHLDMWQFSWHTMPTVTELPFLGGSYRAGIRSVARWFCKNPIGETKIDPSDA